MDNQNPNSAGPLRPLLLSGGLFVLSIAFQLSQAKGWADFVPDGVVYALWFVPIIPLGWWLLGHERLKGARGKYVSSFWAKPKITIALSALATGIICVCLFFIGTKTWHIIISRRSKTDVTTPMENPTQQGNQNPPPQPGVPHTADKSAKPQGPGREGTTDANPLDLVDFNPFKGGTIYNKTSRQIYVLGITTTVRSLGGDESRSIPLDFEIPAHDTKSSFPNEETGQWSTLDYQTADWLNAWSNAYAAYKQCAHPIVMLPSGIQLTQLREHYRTENKPFPVGDAEAKITYRIGGETRDEVLPMKAVIFVQNGCVPQSPTPQESPKPAQPVASVMLKADFINPVSPSLSVYNPSTDVVEGVIWEMVAFRTSDLCFFGFQTKDVGYIKPQSKSANYEMDLATMPKSSNGCDGAIRPGDELTGSVSIDCPHCSIQTYIVHLVWQQSGWYFESDMKAGYVVPKDLSPDGRRKYIQLMTSEQFLSRRIEITQQQ